MARGNILVTLLAPRLTATIESAMAALMVQFGLQEEHRQRLARRIDAQLRSLQLFRAARREEDDYKAFQKCITRL